MNLELSNCNLTPDDFLRHGGIDLVYGNAAQTTERFVITTIRGIRYAVSLEFGIAYTRPQLISKYQNVGALYTLRPMTGAYNLPPRIQTREALAPSESVARSWCEILVGMSAWFTCTPLPDDVYRFEMKSDAWPRFAEKRQGL